MRQKKAEAMSINLIIVAAIALIVMIILIMIFTGNIGKWRRSAESCESKRGVCVPGDDDDNNFLPDACQEDYTAVMPYNCSGTGKVCCLKQLS